MRTESTALSLPTPTPSTSPTPSWPERTDADERGRGGRVRHRVECLLVEGPLEYWILPDGSTLAIDVRRAGQAEKIAEKKGVSDIAHLSARQVADISNRGGLP